MGLEFFQTVMGHNFYEHEFPRLADAVEKLADEVEKMNKDSACKSKADRVHLDISPLSVVLERDSMAERPAIYISLADENGNALCDIASIEQLADAENRSLATVRVWNGPASDAEVCKFVVALPEENLKNERK